MINAKLKQFNLWWDEFILELIKPMAILSMTMGTVAVFNLSGLAIRPWFVTSWAIVQAMSIDGLFFATWDRFFTSKRSWAMIGLLFVGITLAIVAVAINAILGFQVLWAIADSQQAMTRLGINSSLFTFIRAILAVTVFIMIAYVRTHTVDSPPVAPVSVAISEEHSPLARSPRRAKPPTPVAIAEHASITHSLDDVAMADSHVATGEPSDSPSIATSNQGHRERIKATWLQHSQEGRAIQLTEIAADAGVGYSTVKKYAASIRAEIEQETLQSV